MKDSFVLIIVQDWRERAFLRAELIEQGISALAVDSVAEAANWLSDPFTNIIAAVYDSKGYNRGGEALHSLFGHENDIPLIVISDALEYSHFIDIQSDFDVILKRPVAIGSVVSAVKKVLAKTTVD